MAEEIRQDQIVRYDSSTDLQEAWLKGANMDVAELSQIWRASVDRLNDIMTQQEDLGAAFKAANRLSYLMLDVAKMYSDLAGADKQNRGGTIDVSSNPFGGNHGKEMPQ